MNIKKLFSVAITASLLLGGLPAYSAENVPLNKADIVSVNKSISSTASYIGYVKDLITDDSQTTAVVIADEDGKIERRFNLSELTVILDNETGIAQNMSSVKKGDKISVVASPIATFSIPPQSPAYVILVNINGKSPAKLLKVQDIEDKDGSISITDTNNQYIVNITKDTSLMPYRTKQLVRMDSIIKGDYILVWSETMTMSIPAHMTADRLVLLSGVDFKGSDENEVEADNTDKIILSTQAGVISVNGMEINEVDGNFIFYKNNNGTNMLPLRVIAEALGYKVQWFGDEQRVEVFKGAKTFTINIDSKEYGKQKMRQLFKNVAEIKNGRTYVPVEFFKELMEIDTVINEGNI